MVVATPPAHRLIATGDMPPEIQRLLFDPGPEATQEWIEALLTIESERGQVVPFRLYPQQKQMLFNQTGRDITVKGRQTRASSLILARNLRRMTTGSGLKCLVMTHDARTTQGFRLRIRHHLRDLAQHGLDYDLPLDNDHELVIGGLENRYIFASGEERVSGRAYTAHLAHLSELAHYPPERASNLFGAINPSVPSFPAGWLDIESTPFGAEGLFYNLVMDSQPFSQQSRWITHLYPWWLEPRYKAGVEEDCDVIYTPHQYRALRHYFEPDAEEARLMQMHGLTVDQMLWRRVRKAEQDKTDAPFKGEYPEDLESCFITAGGNYFSSPDGNNYMEVLRRNVAEPLTVKDSLPYMDGQVGFYGPNLYVWQVPQPGHPYVLWTDCAGGGLSEGSDFSAVIVMNALDRSMAARLNIKAAPQELAPMVTAIATWYNTALLGGERDAYGSVCLAGIQELGYRNLWYFIDLKTAMSPKSSPIEPWGHPTQIRNQMLMALREAVFANTFRTFDKLLVQQMGAFTWQKVSQKRETMKAAGKRGHKDDLVMCAAGCCLIAEQARARYRANTKAEDEAIVVVGPGGIVLRKESPRSRRKVWLR